MRCSSGGHNQTVPCCATVRSTTPPPNRVTSELLPRIATQISVSGFVFFHVNTPRSWVRSSAESPDQPKSTEEASTPCAPYTSNPFPHAPTDSLTSANLFSELSTIYPPRSRNSQSLCC